VEFGLEISVVGRCAACGHELEDWEERTAGAGKPRTKVTGESGVGYLVETGQGCPRCPSKTVRVVCRIGDGGRKEADEAKGTEQGPTTDG